MRMDDILGVVRLFPLVIVPRWMAGRGLAERCAGCSISNQQLLMSRTRRSGKLVFRKCSKLSNGTDGMGRVQ